MSQHAEAKEGKEQVTLTIGVAWRSETGDRVRGSAASTASQGAWSVSWRTEQTKERSLCSPAGSNTRDAFQEAEHSLGSRS